MTLRTRYPLRRVALAATAALATVALLAGCASGTAPQAATTADEPKEGGDITFLIDSLGATWIPNSSSISSYQGHVWGHLTDKLIYVDEEGNLSPWVAESWEQSDDATEFTIHLKDGVTFSDGTPVDADAVVANIDIWAKGDPDKGIARIGLFPSANYVGAEAVDDATVTVTFAKPTLSFIPTLAYHGSILISPETLALPAEEQADLSNDIGSGPFVVESWKEGDSVVLTKRDDYDWGPEALEHTGPAYLDSITYKIVAEPTLRTGSVESNQADVAYNASPQELDALKDEGLVVATPRYLGFVNGYALNTSVAPFGDEAVRQAFSHGIDRDEILSTVYTDDWHAAETFVQSNVPEATDHSDAFAYDPEESEKLLDDAGWAPGADGIREKDGQQLAVTLYANPYLATSKSIDELVAQQLAEIGFKVDIEAYDVVTYGEKVIGNKTLQANEITRSFVDIGTIPGVLTGSNQGDEDWFKLGTSDTTLNELAAELSSATDKDSRAATFEEVQQYVLEQGYFVPITQIVQRIYVQTPDLEGVTYNGLAYANYYTAWLDR
ncbi:ABC transporter substrate-binding protein [Microbacterium sp. SS28]|uniref:ABC transporter substrate-binding protein n=1 Tax=Microbacterium sp. SS28 TaxID=2919948 RepID=UPI001FA9E05E|nr:ABC transporter substrate-binding protein [Microbacterium sp. SS28]